MPSSAGRVQRSTGTAMKEARRPCSSSSVATHAGAWAWQSYPEAHEYTHRRGSRPPSSRPALAGAPADPASSLGQR